MKQNTKEMKQTDYYATVNYRGKEKIYHITAEQDNDIRVEYVDYNPNREYNGVWIFNGKERIKNKFESESKEYKYYKALNKEWENQIGIMEEQHKRVYNVSNASLGTDHYKKAYKLALKNINLIKDNINK